MVRTAFFSLFCSVLLLGLVGCGNEREPLFALSRLVIRVDQTVPAATVDHFLDDSLTPLFPAGVTRVDGRQQWRNADGTVTSAPCVIFDIIHLANQENNTRIDGALLLAKRQFGLHAVMLVQGRPEVRY